MPIKKINDIKINPNDTAKILGHKDFAPLDEQIVEVEERSKKSKVFKIATFGILGLIVVFYLAHFFSSATISIQKKRVPYAFSNTLVVASQSEGGELPFAVVEVTDTHHEQVVPDTLNSSPKKATGSVVIYNNGYTKSKTTIRKGAVLTAPNNIKFTTDETVTLPGYTIDTNKQIIPGQVIAKITAQKTGASFNIGNADLVLDKYLKSKAKIYARTNEPIAGGADQMAYGMSETLKASVSSKIDEALKKSLFIKAGAEIPNEYVLYVDMFNFEPKSLIISGTPQSLDVSKEASLIAYVFKKRDIERLIETRLGVKPPVNPRYLGLEDLVVKLASKPSDAKNPQTIDVNFTGQGEVISYVNTTDLSARLKSLNIRKAKKVISEIESIESYQINIRPKIMWLMPKNSHRIKIIDVKAN